MSTEILRWRHEGEVPGQYDCCLTDCRFMRFGGQVQCAFICRGLVEGDLRVVIFDYNWNHLSFSRHYSNAAIQSAHLKEQISISECIAESFPFVCVDFFEIADKLYLGEMTIGPKSSWKNSSLNMGRERRQII